MKSPDDIRQWLKANTDKFLEWVYITFRTKTQADTDARREHNFRRVMAMIDAMNDKTERETREIEEQLQPTIGRKPIVMDNPGTIH